MILWARNAWVVDQVSVVLFLDRLSQDLANTTWHVSWRLTYGLPGSVLQRYLKVAKAKLKMAAKARRDMANSAWFKWMHTALEDGVRRAHRWCKDVKGLARAHSLLLNC